MHPTQTTEIITRASRIFDNAIRLGADAFHAAAALDLAVPIDGHSWHNLCVWCAEAATTYDAPGLPCRVRSDAAGGCAWCAYSGRDTIVVPVVL